MAESRKTNVSNTPMTKLIQGSWPEAAGIKAPTTNEPNKIFAPSSKNSDNTLICSSYDIEKHSQPFLYCRALKNNVKYPVVLLVILKIASMSS